MSRRIYLRAVVPNRNIEMYYRRTLKKLIRRMNSETLKIIESTYKKNEALIAGDSKPANRLQKSINYVKIKYRILFTKLAGALADRVISKINKDVADKIKKDLKSRKLTALLSDTDSRAFRTVKNSLIKANVALIKSIPAKYFDEIEQTVMESVSRGRDLSYLSDELEKHYGVVKRRAQLISRDQNDKITSALNIARQKDLGITKNIWVHSGAGREPRPSHVRANGRIFDIDKGLKIDGAYIFPGQLINCFPGNAVLTGSPFIEKVYRHRYRGALTRLITDTGAVLTSTPNHPYRTVRGWQSAQCLNIGDNIIAAADEAFGRIIGSRKNIITIADIFDMFVLTDSGTSVSGGGRFHGDSTAGDIDIIDTVSTPSLDRYAGLRAVLGSFDLTESDVTAFLALSAFERPLSRLFIGTNETVEGFWRTKRARFVHMWGCLSRSDKIRLGLTARFNIMTKKDIPKSAVHAVKQTRDPVFALAFLLKPDSTKFIAGGLNTDAADKFGVYPVLPRILPERIGADTVSSSRLFEAPPRFMEPDKIVDKRFIDWYGYVYNLQTFLGYYTVSNRVVSNCRCYSRPVLDIED